MNVFFRILFLMCFFTLSVGCDEIPSSGDVNPSIEDPDPNTTPDPDPPAETAHIIFVSSTATVGNSGGLSGMDANCTAAALGAGLGGTYVALISASTVDAKDRVTISDEIQNTNGDVVANNATDLWDGDIDSAIDYDEDGNSISGNVFTGSTSAGVADIGNCSDWTGTGGKSRGGQIGSTDGNWISSGALEALGCSSSNYIYCISSDPVDL